jgi:hypothetical protein
MKLMKNEAASTEADEVEALFIKWLEEDQCVPRLWLSHMAPEKFLLKAKVK